MIAEPQPAAPTPTGADRVCFMGPTGSGKTELAKALLRTVRNVIALDPKHRFEMSGALIAHDLRALVAQLRKVEHKRSGAPVIYRPCAADMLPKNIAAVDEVFRIALARGQTTVYVDEMGTLAQSAMNFQDRLPHWFRAVTQGRQAGVGIWSAFQRPAHVPLIAMSESDIRIAFYLRMRADQRRAEELCGPVDWAALAQHHYAFIWGTDREQRGPVRLRLGSQHTEGVSDAPNRSGA